MRRPGITRDRLRAMAAATCAALASLLGTVSAPAALAAVPATNSVFHPLSVTFVSLTRGWALGTVPCKSAGACLALRETTNAGHTWAARPLPAKLVRDADRTITNGLPNASPGSVRLPAALYGPYGLEVRFADARDGWIYGGLPSSAGSLEAVLWSTHDGGATWHHLAVLPGDLRRYDGVVFDLEAAGGTAYLMAPNNSNGVSVESSPVGSDNWRPDTTPPLRNPAGGGQQSGAILLQGTRGWLLEGNDRGVTGSAQLLTTGKTKWSSWAPPCAQVGNSFFVPAASTATNLVAVCQMGGFAYPLSKSAPPGARLGSYWLYVSKNGGASFSASRPLGGTSYPFSGPLASSSPSHIFLGYGAHELLASFNSGRTWASVYKADFFYLGFTSPTQGVGLAWSSPPNRATTRMVMTFDGGRHWAPVVF